jgi:hypothetical protein
MKSHKTLNKKERLVVRSVYAFLLAWVAGWFLLVGWLALFLLKKFFGMN